ncbi:MAG: LysR substrate-binding domain-containing protein [Erythrobacter sp.]|uniref:LysR substrate-binding domain-containing protein n=1 Tax=Erythrobacter sp. TaxID=1042 RepID=UPI00262827B4|nr:LysR substrate-binding domain-containing protein [Erythrobacter sp.]MDJ0979712.1 LysR substrate-binding domain-containing protein [Erythrobacter sp.]
MEIRQLRYFVAVAEEQNFGLAARRLNVSQPPITRQIRKLEEELEVQLLRRLSKGSELTEAGRVFLDDAREILAAIERSSERVRAAQRGELGAIEIAYFGSVSYSLVPQILRLFKARNPEVELSLRRLSKSEQVAALKQGDLHVGFGRYYSPEPGLVVEEIVAEGISLCVPESYSADLSGVKWVEVFRDLPLVLFPAEGRPNFADETLTLLKREGVSPRVGAVAEDGRAALMQVAIGEGACLVPDSMVGMNWYGVRIVHPDALRADCPVSIIYRHADTSPLMRRFVTAMRDFRPEDFAESARLQT